jgi:hypothetical protein
MSGDAGEALARTVQLIALDVFGSPLGEDQRLEAAIVRGLQGTTIRLVADAANLSSDTGQTALITLFGLLAMMGIGIDLDVPDVPLHSLQPPLREAGLRSALIAYGHDLIPNARICLDRGVARPDLTFLLGDSSPAVDEGPLLRLTGTAWRCLVARDTQPRRWKGSWPLGALAAAGAAAAEGFRVALRRVSEATGRPIPKAPYWRFSPDVRVELDLSAPGLTARPVDVKDVDFISGGAITTAALYCLHRIPGLSGNFRVIDADEISLDNLNRYVLARRSDWKKLKVDILARNETNRIRIAGIPVRFDDKSRMDLGPLMPRVLVGVDDIPSRGAVQRAADGFVCVAGTSHFYGIVTTHKPGQPCAACAHPEDDDTPGHIPTISFVSFWAGLMQARALLIESAGATPKAACLNIWPLGLDGPHALHPTGVAARSDCPIRCPASRAIA